MNTLSVWVTVGLVCMLMCHTLAGDSADGKSKGPTDCLPESDPGCRNATNKAELNGVRYCCPRGAGSISTSSSNINGVQKDSCKCGGRVKMPEMPKFDWSSFDNPFYWKI
ncbi:uncharacterized protein LOC124253318 isoform X2 [Haliotis rubra]|uniref:uncharacterized protein LOC124253318 isoform X1 n=1 Tax=Haliotis rubra TaxID=36100 RepID=UPI001EE60EED|nr:uncharacterized protein LOC124253318 isoform X1 [Haliotis rubra]XP_046543023.1 uncharacterized protein LOC124253318 isoform X1 [Haliotis rubra]XP_046543024.1 uncharacterized protein LOC124253318 isoform X1 [Haliotis rubra]XP_046543025.1 uncharacterized protein LOC124253318 isoform X2 [Haliotis rubra]XP_046543026.1 uncharacterized protein LOC124253318 isoform X2 [Haliotis rubra]